MVTEVRFSHPSKDTLSATTLTLEGMVMDVKLLQPEKASEPMSRTLLGMLMEVKFLQPEKAPLMDVTLLGMMVFAMPKISVFVAV